MMQAVKAVDCDEQAVGVALVFGLKIEEHGSAITVPSNKRHHEKEQSQDATACNQVVVSIFSCVASEPNADHNNE